MNFYIPKMADDCRSRKKMEAATVCRKGGSLGSSHLKSSVGLLHTLTIWPGKAVVPIEYGTACLLKSGAWLLF